MRGAKPLSKVNIDFFMPVTGGEGAFRPNPLKIKEGGFLKGRGV